MDPIILAFMIWDYGQEILKVLIMVLVCIALIKYIRQ